MSTQKHILLVDDEPDILEFLSYNFRKREFVVSTAGNGLEGIRKAEQDKPEIIISDILMPEMNGIEMCREMRKRSYLQDVPFIFLTAVKDDSRVMSAMMAGANQYASKPIRFEYLLSMVNQLLSLYPPKSGT